MAEHSNRAACTWKIEEKADLMAQERLAESPEDESHAKNGAHLLNRAPTQELGVQAISPPDPNSYASNVSAALAKIRKPVASIQA